MTYDASDPKQVKEKAKIAKADEKAKENFVLTLMGSREGRLFTRELLEGCHVFHSSFAADPYKTAFAEGERNVGLKVLGLIMASCPDRYVEMMKEKPE